MEIIRLPPIYIRERERETLTGNLREYDLGYAKPRNPIEVAPISDPHSEDDQ